jgi:hypothetical protein
MDDCQIIGRLVLGEAKWDETQRYHYDPSKDDSFHPFSTHGISPFGSKFQRQAAQSQVLGFRCRD